MSACGSGKRRASFRQIALVSRLTRNAFSSQMLAISFLEARQPDLACRLLSKPSACDQVRDESCRDNSAVALARPTWMSRRIHWSMSVDRQSFNSEREHGVSPEESQWLVRVRSVQVSVDRLRSPVRADRGRRLCRLSRLVLTLAIRKSSGTIASVAI